MFPNFLQIIWKFSSVGVIYTFKAFCSHGKVSFFVVNQLL